MERGKRVCEAIAGETFGGSMEKGNTLLGKKTQEV